MPRRDEAEVVQDGPPRALLRDLAAERLAIRVLLVELTRDEVADIVAAVARTTSIALDAQALFAESAPRMPRARSLRMTKRPVSRPLRSTSAPANVSGPRRALPRAAGSRSARKALGRANRRSDIESARRCGLALGALPPVTSMSSADISFDRSFS